jgi:membrane protease YdiL (CAAX protease family)
METTARVLLAVLLIVTFAFFGRDQRQYKRFKALEDTESRQSMLRGFMIESLLLYGVVSIVCLVVLDRISAMWALPSSLDALLSPLKSSPDAGDGWSSIFNGLVIGIIAGISVGPTAFTILAGLKGHEKKKAAADRAAEQRNFDALLPRNANERKWTTLLALNAGLSEELFFRLVAPLLILMSGASALVAVIGATVWFALAHLYQGWTGILATFLLGGLLMLIYLYTGSLWLVIAIHALLDLNQMAIAPWLRQRAEERAEARSSQPVRRFDDSPDGN